MATSIESETLGGAWAASGADFTYKDVLPGEIEGIRTLCGSLAPGASRSTEASEGEGRVYIFFAGSGSVDDGDATHEIGEIAFFAPRHNTPFTMRAGDGPLQFLELVVELSPVDKAELAENAAKFPIFLPYSRCKTYRERIKSEKTTSRTLLAEYTFPRLCIGSVETTGDDSVAPHSHPMLEQFFFGLEDNDCVVTADDAELAFGEGVLLHIPLGSEHGVSVAAPKKLHYIWIDLFREREGMEWITQEHIPDEPDEEDA